MDRSSDEGGGETTAILAQLSVRRGFAAIEFYKAAFGTVEDYRVGGSRADEPVVAQLSVDGASFWVADESPPRANYGSLTRSAATGRSASRWGPGRPRATGRRS